MSACKTESTQLTADNLDQIHNIPYPANPSSLRHDQTLKLDEVERYRNII